MIDDPFTTIKQRLMLLVESRKLKDVELVQVIDAVVLLTQPVIPTWKQKVMLTTGLLRKEDLWQSAYDQRMKKLHNCLKPQLLKIVNEVIALGVNFLDIDEKN